MRVELGVDRDRSEPACRLDGVARGKDAWCPWASAGVLGVVSMVCLVRAVRTLLGGDASRSASRTRGVVYGSIAAGSLVMGAGIAISGGDLRSPWFAGALIIATALGGVGRVAAYRADGRGLFHHPDDPSVG